MQLIAVGAIVATQTSPKRWTSLRFDVIILVVDVRQHQLIWGAFYTNCCTMHTNTDLFYRAGTQVPMGQGAGS